MCVGKSDESNLEVILRCKDCGEEKNISEKFHEQAEKMKNLLRDHIEGR